MSTEEKSARNTATLSFKGPMVLRGRVRLNRGAAAPPDQFTIFEMCRCGASSTKPFCDRSHSKSGFADPGQCAKAPDPVEHAVDGEITLNPIPNGPMRIDGWFELKTTDGNNYVCGEKTWLCRCGHSSNKPFCDGTHKKIGFSG